MESNIVKSLNWGMRPMKCDLNGKKINMQGKNNGEYCQKQKRLGKCESRRKLQRGIERNVYISII